MVWISYHPNNKIQSSESDRFILVIQTLQHYVSEIRKHNSFHIELYFLLFILFYFIFSF